MCSEWRVGLVPSTFGFNLSSFELLLILTREFCDTSTCFLALSLCFANYPQSLEEVSCWSSVTTEPKSNLLTKNFHSHHPMAVITFLSNWQLRCCCIRRDFYSRMKWWPSSSRIKLGWWAVSRSRNKWIFETFYPNNVQYNLHRNYTAITWHTSIEFPK